MSPSQRHDSVNITFHIFSIVTVRESLLWIDNYSRDIIINYDLYKLQTSNGDQD